MNIKKAINCAGGVLLAAVIGLLSPTQVFATTISELRQQKEQTEQLKKDTEKKLNSLNSDIEEISEEKAAVEEEVEELDEILVDLLIEVDLLQADIEEKNAAIEQAKIEYEEAIKREEEQKRAMALRIKYMYEKGNESYFEILLESKSMAEAVNRVDFTEKLYGYDRIMLEQYQLAKQDVAEKEARLETELSELEEVEEDYEIQKEQLNNLLEEKKATIENFASQLSEAKARANEYKAQIKQQSDNLKKINQAEQEKIAEEARKKAEEEARRKAEAAAAKKRAEEEAKKEAKRKAKEEAEAKEREEEKSEELIKGEEESEDNDSKEESSEELGEESKNKDSEENSDDSNEDSNDDEPNKDDDTKESDVVSSEEEPNEEKQSASGSGRGTDIANFALKFVGNPYVPGGTSLTNGCDCSGFTQGVYSNFGISIPRSSYSQAAGGTAIDYSNIQAGDIIYYGGHVGIYIGNNQIVHASTPATGIKVSSAFYRTILTIRRYY